MTNTEANHVSINGNSGKLYNFSNPKESIKQILSKYQWVSDSKKVYVRLDDTTIMQELLVLFQKGCDEAVTAELENLIHTQSIAMPIPNFIDLVQDRIKELKRRVNHE